MKKFNTTGLCNPSKHYMVNLDTRLQDIKAMVDAGEYFAINRARQYGKTTTLSALRKYLAPEYEVVSISFEGVSQAGFATEGSFVQEFCRLLRNEKWAGAAFPESVFEKLTDYYNGAIMGGTILEFSADKYFNAGKKEGREETSVKDTLSGIRRAIRKQKLTLEAAMDYMDIPQEEHTKYAEMLREEVKTLEEIQQ